MIVRCILNSKMIVTCMLLWQLKVCLLQNQNCRDALNNDDVCQQMMQFCANGWWNKVSGLLKQYFPVPSELIVQNGLLLQGSRLVIPSSMLSEILQCLHTGHQGITKCHEKAKHSVWWPGFGKQLETVVRNCNICCQFCFQPTEPLIATEPLQNYRTTDRTTELSYLGKKLE